MHPDDLGNNFPSYVIQMTYCTGNESIDSCIWYCLLIAKFRAFGLSLSACDLLWSYLSNRHQRVKIKGSRSERREVKKEHTRAQFLAPCFLIPSLWHASFCWQMFIVQLRRRQLHIYCFPRVHDVVSNLETDCNNIMECFSVNGLQANPSSYFQFMLLSSSNIDKCNIPLRIDDISLKPEPHVKILGVFLDDKLSFNQHVSISCTKAARQLNALARISRYLNISSRSLLYNRFVRSNFNYCAMVWHFCEKTQTITKLKRSKNGP